MELESHRKHVSPDAGRVIELVLDWEDQLSTSTYEEATLASVNARLRFGKNLKRLKRAVSEVRDALGRKG